MLQHAYEAQHNKRKLSTLSAKRLKSSPTTRQVAIKIAGVPHIERTSSSNLPIIAAPDCRL